MVHMDVLLVFKGLSAPYNSHSNDMIPQEILCPSCAPLIYNSFFTMDNAFNDKYEE
jgi:hypothetical protein